MRVRELTADDLLPYQRLTRLAFGGGPVTEQEARPFSPGLIPLGISSADLPGGADGVIAAGAQIRRDRITLGGGTADCGGIGGVAVHPAHRAGGLFRHLMTAVIARCAAEGMAFSMLYPANVAIYRALGYQIVTQVQKIQVPLLDLQRLRPVPGTRLEPVTAESFERVHALYRELTAGDNGMLTREGPLFPTGHPGGTWEAVLLTGEDGTDRGYLSFTRTGGEEGIGLEVHEVLGRTREDRLALLRSLGTWSTVTEQARIRVRAEDPLLDALPGGRTRMDPQLQPWVMVRVIDTAAALSARPAPAGLEGTLRLVVTDDTVPAGTARAAGEFVVRIADGRVAVDLEGAADGSDVGGVSGSVHLDVHAAALLLIGGRSIADAERLGLGARADAPARALLDTLLSGPRPAVMDQF